MPATSGVILVPKDRKLQVAVTDFESRGLSDIETGAVTDFFRSALVNTNAFVVVDRNNMEKILTEQKFQQTGCTTQECAVQIGKILNVEKIFTGSTTLMSGVYYLNVKIIDVATSQVQAVQDAETKSVHDLKKTAERLAQGFIQRLSK
ncbi:MAG: hypothetical protein HY747_12425 [Elusimicrobia bacterium]|nr:hypothetical protein [Elusimicrobiota bacterium]